MKNVFATAKFIDYKTIMLNVFSSVTRDKIEFFFCIDGEKVSSIFPKKSSSMGLVEHFTFELNEEIKLGHEYSIRVKHLPNVIVDVNDLALLDDFDDRFAYDGELGSFIENGKTIFKVWAPLASFVYLKYIKNCETIIRKMERLEKGVYSLIVDDNLDGILYRYVINNSGHCAEVIDPYGKSSNANGEYSAVVDLSKINENFFDENVIEVKDYSDLIIYETHVKDFTINAKNIKNKGKFLGLVEEGVKSKKGNPVGIDYLKYLGITHVQLLPVLDFKTVNENKPDEKYNWGYDPQQYFTLEGSYSTNPNDPYARIFEFSKMVSGIHKNGIGVILDVVYNHVFEYEFSIFDSIVPNYYFRRRENGKIVNSSGCGNDLWTERKMVRKLIIDSAVFMAKTYHIDGYRFDLMGLIDIETMKVLENEVKKINPNFILYGEGWNMYSSSNHKYANMDNSKELLNYAFFNDRFRMVVNGNGSSAYEKGFGYGNGDYREGVKFVLLGCSKQYLYPALFASPNQSINYIECHDNGTIYDKIEFLYSRDDEEKNLRRLHLLNALVILSFGIPFIHMGQEIGLSKKGRNNTYKDNDGINYFDYDLYDQRFYSSRFVKELIEFRKNSGLFDLKNKNISLDDIKFENIGKYGIVMSFEYDKSKNYKIIFNPKNETLNYDLKGGYEVKFDINGDLNRNSKIDSFIVTNALISPISFFILFTK